MQRTHWEGPGFWMLWAQVQGKVQNSFNHEHHEKPLAKEMAGESKF